MMQDCWQHRTFLTYCLTPFSGIYRIITSLRRLLFRLKIKKTTHFKIPIIIVGNITVGGTGKTPLVIWLANFLKQQGFKPGIVSRGYGGKNVCYPCAVTINSDPQQVGDEAVLIARNTHCPMVVDPNRVRAVTQLLQDHDCNIVISDDGLQHYALGRTIEIAVIDAARGFGNGFCLPAGPLREPVKRLDEVDFVIINGKLEHDNGSIQKRRSAQGALATEPTKEQAEINMLLISADFCQLINSVNTKKSDYFKNQTVHAVAGIGNPQRFFDSLRAMGLTIIEHLFADHYNFQLKDFNFAKPDEWIIMTEKDAVKCQAFADDRYWYLPVRAELPENFGAQLLGKISE